MGGSCCRTRINCGSDELVISGRNSVEMQKKGGFGMKTVDDIPSAEHSVLVIGSWIGHGWEGFA